MKRLLDVALAAAALVLLSPLVLIAIALIRLTSPGPVFFRQERLTQGGRPFRCLKLRTMRPDADPTPHLALLDRLIGGDEAPQRGRPVGPYKLTGDRRVTSVGRWLRKSSLDEVPQLWNVLRGEMSLVGPQAPIAFEVERYQPEWLLRLAVPAGLTGAWQIRGRGRVSYARMIELDLDYVEHWSLRRDLSILLLTIPSVLLGRGAR